MNFSSHKKNVKTTDYEVISSSEDQKVLTSCIYFSFKKDRTIFLAKGAQN
jgi:hypothetical protein